MKRLLSVILLISLFAGIISGCGGDEDKETSSVSEVSVDNQSQSSSEGEVEFVHSENPVIAEPSTCPLSNKQIEFVKKNTNRILSETTYSGTVLISVGNQIIFEESYGYSDKNKSKNTNSTYYQIGSLTKQFTGAAILLLEREGKIKTTDTIDKYFDGDKYLQEITVDHLLKMTSGMGDYMQIIENNQDLLDKYLAAAKKSDEDAKNFIVKVILDEGLYTDPGEVYAYSNSAYYLLGIIIEKITGMSYKDYVQKNFFDAAGMTDTYFVGDGKDSQVGYYPATKEFVSDKDDEYLTVEGDYPYLFSAGSIVSTAEDVNKWLDTVDSETIINSDDYKKIESAEFLYNYGWNTSDHCWHHSGRTYAYSSQVFFDYKTGVKLVMLTNIPFYSEMTSFSYDTFKCVNDEVKKAAKSNN